MSTRIRAWLIAVALSTIQAVGGDVAAALAQGLVPVKREIIALYDGAQEGDAELTRIHRFAEMPDEQAKAFAIDIWERVNLVNLVRNVAPTRERAQVVMQKGPDHTVQEVWLRRV